ncbi:hypothetical protein AAE478_010228 [Parahypoxylon ruwenzoriense]
MEDLRNARDTVAHFAELIDRLQPEKNQLRRSAEQQLASLPAKRHVSNGSDGSRKSSSKTSTSTHHLWSRSVGKSWADSPSGALWNHISNTLEDVAADQRVNATALKEFISTPEILELGSEFARYYRSHHVHEKAYWAAEDLFFDLQSVKQSDVPASRWTRARSSSRMEWDLANHLTRFVLAADAFRRKADHAEWNGWATDFSTNVSFYLSILRCFTVRDAEQQAARDSGPAKRSSHSSSSKHSRHSREGSA